MTHSLIQDNEQRQRTNHAPFNPITGEGALLSRTRIDIPDFPLSVQYIPDDMLAVPLVKELLQYGSVADFLKAKGEDATEENTHSVVEQFVRVRCRYDFCFWAALYIFIKAKGGGDDIRFVLNRPQRKLITLFEDMRLAGMPIRVVLLKARQWGGSTATQIYMAWLQLVHKTGLNSLIVAHQGTASREILDMYNKAISSYPLPMLYELGASYRHNDTKWESVGMSVDTHRIPQRNCKIKIGTAERPDSARGGDYNLIHCSEVGLWRKTEGKSPEDIIQAACSGVLYAPYTMIVYESTANGTGNFFQREYDAAKEGKSQFRAFFVAWHEIEQYETPFLTDEDKQQFADKLYSNRNNKNVTSEREESGQYLYWLWEQGATLEAIHWYTIERAKYNDHGRMASEYPSDDVEAFVHSGARVFDQYQVRELRATCRPPSVVGDIYGDALKGEDALRNVRFKEDAQGLLWIWAEPEIDAEETVTDRYLAVVDIGGRGTKADFSVIVVFDRLYQMENGKPSVVAQWYGHIDMDLLAWKAAQIAAYYDNALLVIESNTLETHDRERQVDGDQSAYILSQIKDCYDNLYERAQSAEDIAAGLPRKFGFHTNVATKPMIISTLVEVIRENLYVERDERCLDEYITYERKPNGAFGAIVGKHDDLLMTRAIGLHIAFHEMPTPAIVRRSIKTRRNKPVSLATI